MKFVDILEFNRQLEIRLKINEIQPEEKCKLCGQKLNMEKPK